MACRRIYLGVDTHSNLAVSLEATQQGKFFVNISTIDLGADIYRFLCTEHELLSVLNDHPLEADGPAGHCAIRAAGDQIVVEFTPPHGKQASACALSANSFDRVLRLAKNRAYAC